MLSQFFSSIWQEAMDRNIVNILSLLEQNPDAKVVDVGCGDGKLTVRFKKKIYCQKIIGIDGLRGRLRAAKNAGVDVTVLTDLEKRWPVPNKSVDVVISNQVIEHLVDIDHFIEEIYRVLKPGGYCVISTENLASWHNIFSLILGFQDFSHHLIKKTHVGSPFSLHYGEKTVSWSAKDNANVDDSAHPHLKIFTFRSLRKIFEAFGFQFKKGYGSGYYPLYGFVSSMVSRADPYHSHFITIKMRKL